MKFHATKVWRNPLYFLAFGFGSGLSKVVPGTCGTLIGIPIYWLLSYFSWPIYFLIVCAAFVFGVYLCSYVSKELGEHDYAGIVWDEIVGYLLVMFLVPRSFGYIILGFVLFRLFDIWKPWPIRAVDEEVKGGLGIMLDDVLAAVPAAFILQMFLHFYGVSV